jgi:hypothetical protein
MTPEELTDILGQIYHSARTAKQFEEGDPADLQFVAAHFTLIDSQYAIDSYSELKEFRDFREAYLMKFGLLQALHNQIKSVEEIAMSVNQPKKLDRLDGVASILVPRQPTLEGRVHHFDLRVAQNWLPTNKEVKCAKEYAFERSRATRAIACCASCGARRGRS